MKIDPSPTASFKVLTLALAVSSIAALAGCASTPKPTEQIAVAEASVRHATTSSTSENAAAELAVATAKLASAKQAMNDEKYDLARQLSEQAELDAQVAVLHAQSAGSRKAALESQDAARVLREEINRKTVR